MNAKYLIGNLAAILGGLLLSIELYSLKIIQCMEMTKGSWQTYASEYASEPVITMALWTTISVIIYGVGLIVLEVKKNRKNQMSEQK